MSWCNHRSQTVMDSSYCYVKNKVFKGIGNMFRISLGTQTFSNVSATIWNALLSKVD